MFTKQIVVHDEKHQTLEDAFEYVSNEANIVSDAFEKSNAFKMKSDVSYYRIKFLHMDYYPLLTDNDNHVVRRYTFEVEFFI